MRHAMLFKYVEGARGCRVLVQDKPVIFHQFGVNFEEFEIGAGNFTSAIIEDEVGMLHNVPVEMIQLLPKSVVK